MLVLSRKRNQSIQIAGGIEIRITKIKGNTVQLGIDAPPNVSIVRSELLEKETTPSPRSQESEPREPPFDIDSLPVLRVVRSNDSELRSAV